MKLMAIVNVTPDSFYDGGQHPGVEAAVGFALQCVAEGAEILDIGGESTRPGSEPVSVEEEIRRVMKVVAGIRRVNATIPISIDTTKSAVIRAAAEHGIQFANDVTALRGDPEMAATVAQLQLKIILMHMQGTPKTMQQSPQYGDITPPLCKGRLGGVESLPPPVSTPSDSPLQRGRTACKGGGVVPAVRAFLTERIAVAVKAGIPRDNILLDPGIGFGKTVDHNVALLNNLAAFSTLGCPLLVGTSRKSFIGKLAGVDDPQQRLPGSLATLPAMVQANVAIIRTHDIAATRQFLRVYTALSKPCFP